MFKHTLAGLLAALSLGGAQAATLHNQGGSTGPIASPGVYTVNFNGNGAGTGTLAFTIDGYNSLDGLGNGYEDVFHLAINGNEVITGAFAMGGGATNNVWLNSLGATFDTTDTREWLIDWAGGNVEVSLNFNLLAGVNTLSFWYSSNLPQGLGDEGWGISGATVTAVPEPGSVALMLAGLGAVGLVGRRRRAA